MNTRTVKLLLFLSILFLAACKHNPTKVTRAFYYWKGDDGYYLGDGEEKYLKELQVQKLYVKFFEVGYDNTMGVIPTEKTDFRYPNYTADSDIVLKRLVIIPTIYIKNEIFPKIAENEIDSLAGNILFLTNKYYTGHIATPYNGQLPFTELQIDCDWTAKTRDKYFQLLRALKNKSGKTISCTLRLYPYKYSAKMGIPPVDKATLMCYNLINPLSNIDKNSILDIDELKSYLSVDKTYPLHLDVALPVYSWMELYQNNRFSGMIYRDNPDILNILKPVQPMWYEVEKDTTIDDRYFRAGDRIKYEMITAPKLQEAIQLLKEKVHFDDSATITFFHLEETNLNQFNHETLDSLYTDFSR